jgi:hypothetical protein
MGTFDEERRITVADDNIDLRHLVSVKRDGMHPRIREQSERLAEACRKIHQQENPK